MSVDVSPRMVSIADAAQRLAISVSTLRRMTETGAVPVVSMSHRIRRICIVDIEAIEAKRFVESEAKRLRTLLASVSSLPCGTDADPTTTTTNPAA